MIFLIHFFVKTTQLVHKNLALGSVCTFQFDELLLYLGGVDAHVFKNFLVLFGKIIYSLHPNLEIFYREHCLFVQLLSFSIELADSLVDFIKNIKFVACVEDGILQFLDLGTAFVLFFFKRFENVLMVYNAVHDGVQHFLHQMSGLGLNVKPKKFKRWVLLAETLKLGESDCFSLFTFFLLSSVMRRLLTDFSRGSFSFSFLSLSSLSGRPPLSLSRSGDLPFAFLSSLSFLSRLFSLFSVTAASLIAEFEVEPFFIPNCPFLDGLSDPSPSSALFLSEELLVGIFLELPLSNFFCSLGLSTSESLRFYNCSLSFIFKIKVIQD